MSKKEENTWVKIIEIKDYQILINKEGYNDEERKHEVRITAFIDGLKMSMIMGFEAEHKMDSAFDQYDESMAERFLVDTVLPLVDDQD